MKIDVHCHGYPAAAFRLLAVHYPERVTYREGHGGGPVDGPLIHEWDDTARIGEMDRLGIDVEILSSPQTFAGGPDEHLGAICRVVNDAFAESVRRHPTRFRSFVHLPFDSADAALAELSRHEDNPGFVGLFLPSNVGGVYPDDARFEPVWRAATRRALPVFLHPLHSACYRDPLHPATLTLPFDSTLAVVRMVSSGVFDRHPELILLVAHLGGTLPFLTRRIDLGFELPDHYGTPMWNTTRLPSETMANLYVDTAQGWSAAAFACARELVGTRHILFGTDHFDAVTRFVERTVESIEGLGLSPSDRDAIYAGNAQRIFGLGHLPRARTIRT